MMNDLRLKVASIRGNDVAASEDPNRPAFYVASELSGYCGVCDAPS